jgi:hypothetical protein
MCKQGDHEMRQRAAELILSVVVSFGAAARVEAQTVFGGAGWTSLWDDETNLGAGIAVSAGIAQPLGRHAAVEGELAWARHFRDSGYLAAEGTPVVGSARLAWHFQRPEARARAFASAGVSIVHSTGTLTTRSIVPGPGGQPIEGPASRRDWSLTTPAFELGGGVSVKSGDRLSFRPEVRWTSSAADRSFRGSIEPPISIIRAGVAVAWRLAR